MDKPPIRKDELMSEEVYKTICTMFFLTLIFLLYGDLNKIIYINSFPYIQALIIIKKYNNNNNIKFTVFFMNEKN